RSPINGVTQGESLIEFISVSAGALQLCEDQVDLAAPPPSRQQLHLMAALREIFHHSVKGRLTFCSGAGCGSECKLLVVRLLAEFACAWVSDPDGELLKPCAAIGLLMDQDHHLLVTEPDTSGRTFVLRCCLCCCHAGNRRGRMVNQRLKRVIGLNSYH